MIPAHAFALKKYFAWIESCSSTCDNEHTAASLGQAEILGIQNPPRGCSLGSIHTTSVLPFAPWRLEFFGFAHQGCEEAAEGVFLVREDAWNVLPPCDALGLTAVGSNKVNCIDGLHELDGQGAARVGQAFAPTCDAEGLAWSPGNSQWGSLDRPCEDASDELCHVPMVWNAGVVVSQHGRWEWFDLGEPACSEPDWLQGNAGRLDAAAHGAEVEFLVMVHLDLWTSRAALAGG